MFEDWILRSQRVVTSGEVRPADIAIAKGRITAVRDVGAAPAGPPVVDVGALAVLPGVVDTHVHVNEPGRTA
jgi:allantoinase